MRIYKIVVQVSCLTLILMPFQNCSPYHAEVEQADLSSSLGSQFTEAQMAAKFDLTLKPFLRQNCAGCHGNGQEPQFAVSDSIEAVRVITAHNLVNLDKPADSRFVAKILGGHNGFPLAWASELQDGVDQWNKSLHGKIPDPVVVEDDTEAPAVLVNSPLDGATLTSSVTVRAVATDNMGVVGVQFYVGTTLLGVEDLSSPYEVSLNPANYSNGSYQISALARDAAGNLEYSVPINITILNSVADTVAPTVALTAPANAATVSGSITITGTASDNVGVVGVRLFVDGTASGTEDMTAPYAIVLNTSSLSNASHSLTLRARDAAGNTTTSAARSVTVSNAAADTTAPVVAISAPANNFSASGNVTVTGTATDNVAVVGVQLLVNGVATGAEDTASPYSIVLNTNSLSNATHAITLRARDAAGNVTTSTVRNIIVSNAAPDTTPPVVAISSPAANANISGTVTITATATDNVGVGGVQFMVGGVNSGAEDTTSPYTLILNTSTLANGTLSVSARARDTSGGTATASRSFTVNNVVADTTAPTVSISSPTASSSVSGSITIAATAADAVGVVGVQFYIDGVATGAEDTSAPYSVVASTTSLTNASHALTARARDAAGNMRTSTAVNVTVNNAVANPNAKYSWIFTNVLQPRCLNCHGASGASAGVRYDTYARTMLTVSANNPSGSKLYSETSSGSMPVGGSDLTATQLTAIRDWINAGAPNN